MITGVSKILEPLTNFWYFGKPEQVVYRYTFTYQRSCHGYFTPSSYSPLNSDLRFDSFELKSFVVV